MTVNTINMELIIAKRWKKDLCLKEIIIIIDKGRTNK
jgi:hypothetical protein